MRSISIAEKSIGNTFGMKFCTQAKSAVFQRELAAQAGKALFCILYHKFPCEAEKAVFSKKIARVSTQKLFPYRQAGAKHRTAAITP